MSGDIQLMYYLKQIETNSNNMNRLIDSLQIEMNKIINTFCNVM